MCLPSSPARWFCKGSRWPTVEPCGQDMGPPLGGLGLGAGPRGRAFILQPEQWGQVPHCLQTPVSLCACKGLVSGILFVGTGPSVPARGVCPAGEVRVSCAWAELSGCNQCKSSLQRPRQCPVQVRPMHICRRAHLPRRCSVSSKIKSSVQRVVCALGSRVLMPLYGWRRPHGLL